MGLLALFAASALAAGPAPLAWQDTYDAAAGFDNALAVAASGSLAFTAGDVQRAGAVDSDWAVRTYDARTGQLRWSDQFNKADRNDGAVAIAADSSRVVAAGFVIIPGRNRNFYVRAYDQKTGAVAWQDEVDDTGRGVATDVAIASGVAYVSGTTGACTAQGIGDCDFLVRALDLKTGRLLWQSAYDDGANTYEEAGSISVQGDTVYAAGGVTSANGDPDFFVQALNSRTGALRWQQRFATPGFDVATGVAAFGNKVAVSGSGGAGCFPPDPGSDCDLLVRVYS
jgi:outer membrane protein assembly factor BamB